MDEKRLTRRQLGLAAAVAAIPAQAAAQQTVPPVEGELESARAESQRAIAQLRKVKLPQLLEPGFIFKP